MIKLIYAFTAIFFMAMAASSASAQVDVKAPFKQPAQILKDPSLTPDGKIDVSRFTEGHTWFLWQMAHFDTIEHEIKFLTDPSFRLSNRDFALRNYLSSTWKTISPDYEHLETVDKMWRQAYRIWVTAKPNSPTPHLLHAHYLLTKGMRFRGEGWAQDVSSRDMQMFMDLVKEAKLILENCRLVCQVTPEYYRLHVVVDAYTSAGPRSIMARVRECVTKFPHDHSIYMTASRFLLPVWGGSFKDLFDLADFAAKTSGDNGNDVLYAATIGHARHPVLTDYLRSNRHLWPRIKKGLENMAVTFPTESNHKTYLRLACDAMDADGVQRMYALVFKQDIDPAKYCKWPTTAQNVDRKVDTPSQQRKLAPPELTPEELHRRRDVPRKAGGQSSLR